jgi:hypothetical protein
MVIQFCSALLSLLYFLGHQKFAYDKTAHDYLSKNIESDDNTGIGTIAAAHTTAALFATVSAVIKKP